ncbi:uncharacterized protein PRCAT00001275001 [Priceomyces carsonii]|uniref:uncharacterized protein n=1 Tax=Priceomyces carsonii TaxID=28549 RepID=UPI002EDA3A71|nr:unnamed protein product [Priceomyces carsonii]
MSELLGLKYDTQSVNIRDNVQKEPWFLKLNPNGRIPTLVDNSTGVTISETGAILQYLVDTYDKDYKYSYKVGTKEYYKQLEILYFQMAGVGPMQGQANHFKFAAKEKIPYAIERYENETKRLYSVVEEYLKRNESNGRYLVGNHYSIADIAIVAWAKSLSKLDIDIAQWPLVKEWFDQLNSLSQVQKGFTIP